MKVLIGCEYSGIVRDAFSRKGHDAWSCDLLPTEKEGNHYQCDILEVISKGWDFIGVHTDCTYMANSGVRWLYNKDGSKNIGRWVQLEAALKFWHKVRGYIKMGYMENPIPHKYARDGFRSVITGKWIEGTGKYDQVIQPWQFGHGETKATCFWLFGVEKLNPTNIVEGREQRIFKLPPSKDRWKERSRTFEGIANAISSQYG